MELEQEAQEVQGVQGVQEVQELQEVQVVVVEEEPDAGTVLMLTGDAVRATTATEAARGAGAVAFAE